MKKIVEFVKKHKVYILSALVLVLFFRTCSKSNQIKRLDKTVITYSDSISVVKENSYNQGLEDGANKEKESILDFMDDELRSPQNLRVREKFEELHNSIDNNKHRK